MDSKWLDGYVPKSQDIEEKESENESQHGRRNTGPKQLKKQKPHDTLDLHGCTVDEAESRLDCFIKEMKSEGKTIGLVIPGKGIHSKEDGPILKPLVQKYLEKSSEVGEKIEAPSKLGGAGAILFRLR